jgi:hypothetical protein
MVFSETNVPNIGQQYRDRVRCEALENLGYEVKTLDDKHDSSLLSHGKHCQASFLDSRRFLHSINSQWGNGQKFHHVILDYFFSPVGWARDRWKDSFYSCTLPAIAKNLLHANGKVWLPNIDCVDKAIMDNFTALQSHYSIYKVDDVMQNPLYVASENAVELLKLNTSALLTNETQMVEIEKYSEFPFWVLESKHIPSDKQKQQIDGKASVNVDTESGEDTLLLWEMIAATPKMEHNSILVRAFIRSRENKTNS